MGGRELTDHDFRELEELAASDVATGDYFPVYDISADKVKKVPSTILNTLAGVTATASELNLLDVSAQTETIAKGTAVSLTKRVTKIDSTTGTGAITLAAPDASMIGQVKLIIMAVDGGDITLALTNVQGQSSGTTATFNDASDSLILVAGIAKWYVIKESGVTLS